MRKLNKGIRYVAIILLLVLLALFLQYQHKQTQELELALAKVSKQVQHLELKDEMNDNRSAYMYMVLKDMGKAITTVKPDNAPVVSKEKVRGEISSINPLTYNETFMGFVVGSFFSATQFMKNVVGVH